MQQPLYINKRVALEIKDLLIEYNHNTYNNLSTNAIHEIIRQCFDNLDLDFTTFNNYILNAPNFSVVLDMDLITNDDKLVIHGATKKLFIAIYLRTIEYGLRINNRFPYLLEQISLNTCILYYDSSLTQPNFVIG